ncbi:DUF3180 family protein [Granulicoccus phenolivorans]|uniref:DUF3180 family protein n=1 Tax=Granulicoccus phenolivorans TaxID=266854 RepID=UPI000412047F|nr:DUF3180 family protein [Granulicoccus phenolivorans]
MSEPVGTVRPTRPRHLLLAAALGAVFGGLVLTATQVVSGPPQLPWLGALWIGFIALLVAGIAWGARNRIQVRREPVEPRQAVIYLVLGKAAGLGGAAVFGGYLAVVLLTLPDLGAPGPLQRVLVAAVSALAAAALSAAGLVLEHYCKVPEPPDGESGGESDAGDGAY